MGRNTHAAKFGQFPHVCGGRLASVRISDILRNPDESRTNRELLLPHASAWVRRGQFVAVESTGPPWKQECLPFAR